MRGRVNSSSDLDDVQARDGDELAGGFARRLRWWREVGLSVDRGTSRISVPRPIQLKSSINQQEQPGAFLTFTLHVSDTMSSQSQPHTFNPANVYPPRPTFSHVAITQLSSTTKLITIAGQVGIDQLSGTAPPTFTAQVETALDNLSKCLVAAGGSPRDIVKVTQYVVDLDPKERTRAELYLKFVGDHRPPSTLIGVQRLAADEWLYEIEAMAIVNEG